METDGLEATARDLGFRLAMSGWDGAAKAIHESLSGREADRTEALVIALDQVERILGQDEDPDRMRRNWAPMIDKLRRRLDAGEQLGPLTGLFLFYRDVEDLRETLRCLGRRVDNARFDQALGGATSGEILPALGGALAALLDDWDGLPPEVINEARRLEWQVRTWLADVAH